MARLRKQHLFWFALSLALFIGVGAYFLSRGFSARAEPSAIEAFVARRLRLIAIPRNARELSNPVSSTEETIANGMAHFADHCAICHANDGSGDTDLGRGLYPKPPDMREAETQNLTNGELYYIIQNGIRFTGMPAFGEEGTEHSEDSWGLVHFVRRLPRLTPDELQRMSEMNPKSPAEMRQQEEIERFLSRGA